MHTGEITFCILSYNRPQYLERCINSCLSYADGSKIIVLDNSEDQIPFKVLKSQYPGSIDWVFSDEPLGYAKNFLRAFSVCKSRYLVALHDDDRITENFCRSQLSALKSRIDASAISCNGFFINSLDEKIRPVMPYSENKAQLKVFRTVDEYVEHKYSISGGCIPFSPMMFDLNKSMYLKDIILNRAEEFGQAIDAILIVDLLSTSEVILNYLPLYECGDHVGQDSKVFDNFWESQFMLFLLRKCSISNKVRNKIMTFYMTDLVVNSIKSTLSRNISVKPVISKEIMSFRVVPQVLFAVFTRISYKLKLKTKPK